MAVNKNFVVKNGIEVAVNLIYGDTDLQKVGIGSTVPRSLLDVHGDFRAERGAYITGVTTAIDELNVGLGGTALSVTNSDGFVGVNTASPSYNVEVRRRAGAGATAAYFDGQVNVDGTLIPNNFQTSGIATISTVNISGGQIVVTDLRVTGPSTFVGVGTFESDLYVGGNLNVVGDIVYDEVRGRNIYISGVSTFVGVSTFQNDVYIDGNLNVTGDIVYDEISGRNLYISGVSTFVGESTFENNVYATDKEIYTQFDITNNASSAYQFAATGIGFTQATDNPTLYLTRGKNYHFSVNASGHPFYIKTINSTGIGNSYNDGVTNNGAEVGIVTFKVPYNSPDILHYNCSIHSAMHGEIRVGGGAGIGIGSEGSFIGAGVTQINFNSTNGTAIAVDPATAGIATVTFTPGVSIGLVIALSS